MKKVISILLVICLMITSIFSSYTVTAEENSKKQSQIVMESDFSSNTNWTKHNGLVTYVDEDSDGVNDYARLTSSTSASVGLRSAPFVLIPGNEYELTYYVRIPEKSIAFHTDDAKYYPRYALFQPTLNEDGTQVVDDYSTSKNDYAYKGTRRSDFVGSWQISEYAPYTRKFYSVLDSSFDSICVGETPNDVFADWTKITLTFTAIDDEANGAVGEQVTAFYFTLNKTKDVAGLIYDVKDVVLKNKSIVENENDQDGVVFTDFDDYSDTSKWKLNQSSALSRVSFKDENSDGVKDYVQVTTSSTNKATYISSMPTTLVPGTEYELSFYLRVPEDSADYISGDTKRYPKIAVYQPTIDSETGLVTDAYLEGKNDYAYDWNGKNDTIIRRSAFTSLWQIGNYEPFTRPKFFSFASQHYDACEDTSPNIVYADWTKVTTTFTAIDDETNIGDQVVSVSIGLPNGITNLKLDIKDLVLIDKNKQPELPEEPDAPNNTVYYEDFEHAIDVSTIIETSTSWNKLDVSNTEFVSGSKSASVYAMYTALFIPFDKAILEEDTIYNFSINWKLAAYTTEYKNKIKNLCFVGWDPSTGETLKNDATIINGVTDLNATGDWVNTNFNVKISDLDSFERYGIKIYYAADGETQAQKTIYIDDITLKIAEEQDIITPINLNEAERTEDTIKVLAFGNSFSKDATEFIDELATADGVDLRVGNAWIGGCSLQKHYSKMFDGTFDYTFDYHNPDATGGNKTFSKISMKQALEATDWDYITIQQVSGNSGKIDTFEPYLAELIKYFKEVCPDAEIRLHMTWAYEHEYSGLGAYENSQTVMYKAIQDTYLQISENYGYLRIIPSGEAIQKLRGTDEFADQSLNRDGFHLSDKGRLTAALTWFETFTGISALYAKLDLASVIGTVGATKDIAIDVTAEENSVIRAAAHEAASLFKLANETQLSIEAIGEVTENSGDAITKANALRADLNNDDLLPNLQTLIDANEAYSKFVPEFVAGDITGDDIVDLTDVTLLAQYLASWNVTVNEKALDFDGDSLVNLNDLIALAQFAAGWNVELS